MLTIEAMYISPIKSCGIVSIREATVTPRGLMWNTIGDRRWALMDPETSKVITQREEPSLVLVKTVVIREEASGRSVVRARTERRPILTLVPNVSTDENLTATLPNGSMAPVHAVSEDADEWFSAYLNRPVRLVHQTDDDLRYCSTDFIPDENCLVSLADGYPITVATDGTLKDINRQSGSVFDQRNFRSNIVIGNAQKKAEYGWKIIKFSEASIECVKPSTRCPVTTVDLKTGEFNPRPPGEKQAQPLLTLSKISRVDEPLGPKNTHVKGYVFGENAIPIKNGTISVGEEVRIISRKPQPNWISALRVA